MNYGAIARMNYPVAVPRLQWRESGRERTVHPEGKAAQPTAGLPSRLPPAFPAVLPFYKADTLDTQTTIENGSRIFTVVEILKEVFHEDFHKAIGRYMADCPEGVAEAVGVSVGDTRKRTVCTPMWMVTGFRIMVCLQASAVSAVPMA